MSDATIEVMGETLHLLPERAVYWERRQTLLIADTHFGKADTFRAHGIRLPRGDMGDDLQRLTRLVTRTEAQRLLVLGDLIHAKKGLDESMLAAFAAWRETHTTLEMVLVRGNHDARVGDMPDTWDMTTVKEALIEAPFVFTHQPQTSQAGFVVCGHVHPAVQVVGKGRQRYKLPCFWMHDHVLILPAFGSFIDHAIVQPQPQDRVWVVTTESVIGWR